MASNFRHFETWCPRLGLISAPATPETVALYLADNADSLPVSTLERRLISIFRAHLNAGVHGLPAASARHTAVGSVMKGIRRAKGVATQSPKAPKLSAEVRQITAVFARTNGLRQTRDAATTLVCYSGAFRTSEVTGLMVSSIEWVDAGAVLHVGRSKGRRGRPQGGHSF